MKKQRIMKTLVVASTVLFLLAAWALPASALPKGWPKQIVITSGPMGVGWYPGSVAVSEKLMKQFPGFSVTVTEGGGVGNIRRVDSGRDAQIGLTHSPIFYLARGGAPKFKGVKYLNMRGLFAVMTGYIRVVVRDDSNIRSIADLKDKRIVPGRTTDTAVFLFKALLKEHGLDFNTIRENGGKITFAGYSETPSLFKDGHIDCFVLNGPSPHGVTLDIQSRIPLRCLPVDKPKMEAVIKATPGLFTATIAPGREFKGNKEPVDVLAGSGIYIAHKDLSDDFIYEFTKSSIALGPEVRKTMLGYDLWGWEKGKQGIIKEVMHPGALRAFEEAGYGYK